MLQRLSNPDLLATKMIRKAALFVFICWYSAEAFSILRHQPNVAVKTHHDVACPRKSQQSCCYSTRSSTDSSSTTQDVIPIGESYSTLTLLEHMHLLTPNVHHNYTANESENIIELFVNTMGFGLDPKSINSIQKKSG